MYSDDQLMDMRENFLRNNRSREYERLQRTWELETHLEEHAAACVRRAESYVNALLDRRVICDMLGFDESVYEAVRSLSSKWSAEPSVHGGKDRPGGAKFVI